MSSESYTPEHDNSTPTDQPDLEAVGFVERAAQNGRTAGYDAVVAVVTTPEFRAIVGRAAVGYGAHPNDREDTIQDTAEHLLRHSTSAGRGAISATFLRRVT
jgi:hypothetical protein